MSARPYLQAETIGVYCGNRIATIRSVAWENSSSAHPATITIGRGILWENLSLLPIFQKGDRLLIYLTPIKAIREKCLDCTCQQPKEVRLCPSTQCALWPYRMGCRPKSETQVLQLEGACA